MKKIFNKHYSYYHAAKEADDAEYFSLSNSL